MKKIGPIGKIDPPIRSNEDRKALWGAVNKGVIDVIASDHAPYTKEEKDKGWENIFEAPSGSVSIETSLPLMLDCVNRGLLTIERLCEIFSLTPAKLLHLYPKKGALMPGSDADIVIVDINHEYEIKGEKLHSIQKITPFEGYKGKGLPLMTILRGEILFEDNEVVGREGYGEFLRPQI